MRCVLWVLESCLQQVTTHFVLARFENAIQRLSSVLPVQYWSQKVAHYEIVHERLSPPYVDAIFDTA